MKIRIGSGAILPAVHAPSRPSQAGHFGAGSWPWRCRYISRAKPSRQSRLQVSQVRTRAVRRRLVGSIVFSFAHVAASWDASLLMLRRPRWMQSTAPLIPRPMGDPRCSRVGVGTRTTSLGHQRTARKRLARMGRLSESM